MCSKVPDSFKAFCSVIIEEMTVKIPDVLRTASNYVSYFQLQPPSLGQVSDFEIVAFIPGEESVTAPLNANNQINVTAQTRMINNNNMINPNNLNGFSIQAGGSRGQCNEQTVSGGDTPDGRIIDMGKSRTTVKFSYETYTIKDQIDVYYMNQQVFSTGCVGANGVTTISLNDQESTLRVNVIPDCAGESGTAWYYTFECPNELICEDNVCYCGLNRRLSQQKKSAEINGCGGEGSAFNFIVEPIGNLYKFTPACNMHDECYGTCDTLRASCDNTLLSNMLSACLSNILNPLQPPDCFSWAAIFYVAVKGLGSGFFRDAQKSDCECISKR
ncbi:unnamed protein product [Rotaria sp. Silwood2]|nr:unnamed protein product [Rotaria sp. Silwood2]CAF3189706.1 unnamed protein product [Rotaria sp. Silwood2]CAF3318352.1 unnamed protein product [Rotaria sp. Silwood2]CAF3954385.1 unnamed protein product [Rotaria sp. Silwood2]CAF4301426.1 unnamed protein product [Rotaria sp. Silwood2]